MSLGGIYSKIVQIENHLSKLLLLCFSGIFASVKEIYQQNGVLGFFSGLIPRLVGDILSLCLASSLTYAINHYLIEEKELKVYTSATMSVSRF